MPIKKPRERERESIPITSNEEKEWVNKEEKDLHNLYSLENFDGEKGEEGEVEKLHPFLTKYFSYIFPKLVLLEDEYEAKKEYSKKKSDTKKLDALACYLNEKNILKGFVVLEYKWEDKENPVQQVKTNFSFLKKSDTWKLWNVLKKKNIFDGDFPNFKKIKEEFWKSSFCVCVTPLGYWDWNEDEEELKELEGKKISLVEVRKYENAENYLLLMRAVLETHKKLGMKPKEEQIIQIPKIHCPREIEAVISEFLENRNDNKWTKAKIRDIDKRTSTTIKSIRKKITQDKYLGYYAESKAVLRIYLQRGKREFTIYLKDNRTTTNFDKQVSTNDSGITGQFEKEIIIENEKEFKQFFKSLKSYLSEIKKGLGI